MTRRRPPGSAGRPTDGPGTELCLTTRTVYLGSPSPSPDGEAGVDARFAEAAIKNLHVLESTGEAPITVVLNCIGGDVYHGLAVYDAISCSPCKVRAIVRGHAMSMGSVILQAADWRVMGPNATQLVHYGTEVLHGHGKTVWKQAQEAERLNRWMEQMYLGRIRQKQPRFTLRRLRAMIDHDCFLTAEESVALGLCDEVG